ncbi:MAG: hypothetical protein WA797_13225 [Acidimicrobiales bacterium]
MTLRNASFPQFDDDIQTDEVDERKGFAELRRNDRGVSLGVAVRPPGDSIDRLIPQKMSNLTEVVDAPGM